MIKKIIFITFFVFIISCNQSSIIQEELNSNKIIPSGEWISFNDSNSGLSIVKDKIAFYKNNEFTSDDICEYVIVDSVQFKNQKKTVLSTYLKTYCFKDTVYYKITNRTSTSISLTLQNDRTESYELKKR